MVLNTGRRGGIFPKEPAPPVQRGNRPAGDEYKVPPIGGRWWAFEIIEGAGMIKPLQPPCRAWEKRSPFGGWRHHLSPAIGGTIEGKTYF